MAKKIMTVRSAGSTPPPRTHRVADRIIMVDKLGEESAKKIWKKIIVHFKTIPTTAELQEKKAIIQKYYEKAAQVYQAALRKKEKNPTIKITIDKIQWEKYNPQKYYVLIVMTRRGPADTSVTPPKAPAPPKGAL